MKAVPFSIKVVEIIKIIELDGWTIKRQRGSHRQYNHGTKSGLITIAGKLSKDIPKGTLHSI